MATAQINNVATQTTYQDALTIGPDDFDYINYFVYNATCVAQAFDVGPGGDFQTGNWGPEQLLAPSSGLISKTGGVRFRTNPDTPTTPAQIIAYGFKAGNSQWIGGQPLTQTISSNGNVNPAPGGGAMVLLGSSVLAAPSASFDTNTILSGAIPSTYNHLQIVVVGRSDGAATSYGVLLALNADGAANYDFVYRWDRADGVTSNGGAVATASPEAGSIPGAGATASRPGSVIIDLPLYAKTTFNKNALGRSTLALSTATSGIYNYFNGVTWRNSAAINRVAVTPSTGNWIAGSSFYLYATT